jgi:hypothetical protein
MVNSGIYPFVVSNPATAIQQLRILLNDTDPVDAGSGVGEYKFLSDDEAVALIGLCRDNPKLASAAALETIAFSESLMRKWVSDDVSLDGPATATALRQLAYQRRAEAIVEINFAAEYFDVIGDENSPYNYKLPPFSRYLPTIWPYFY